MSRGYEIEIRMKRSHVIAEIEALQKNELLGDGHNHGT